MSSWGEESPVTSRAKVDESPITPRAKILARGLVLRLRRFTFGESVLRLRRFKTLIKVSSSTNLVESNVAREW